jgi:hypothetical protein
MPGGTFVLSFSPRTDAGVRGRIARALHASGGEHDAERFRFLLYGLILTALVHPLRDFVEHLIRLK